MHTGIPGYWLTDLLADWLAGWRTPQLASWPTDSPNMCVRPLPYIYIYIWFVCLCIYIYIYIYLYIHCPPFVAYRRTSITLPVMTLIMMPPPPARPPWPRCLHWGGSRVSWGGRSAAQLHWNRFWWVLGFKINFIVWACYHIQLISIIPAANSM